MPRIQSKPEHLPSLSGSLQNSALASRAGRQVGGRRAGEGGAWGFFQRGYQHPEIDWGDGRTARQIHHQPQMCTTQWAACSALRHPRPGWLSGSPWGIRELGLPTGRASAPGAAALFSIRSEMPSQLVWPRRLGH